MKTKSKTLAVTRSTSPHGSRLELAWLIESDLAHWRVCKKRPCAECKFIKKILALTGDMIFSEQTWDRPSKLTPARSFLHAKLDAVARSNSRLLPLITEIVDFAYKASPEMVSPRAERERHPDNAPA